jgi:hypothetical protein
VGTPDTAMRATPVSSHTASKNPSGHGSSFESQPNAGGRHIESHTHRDPCNATGTSPAAPLQTYQARRRSQWRLRKSLATTPNNTRGTLAGCPQDLGIARCPHHNSAATRLQPNRLGQDGTRWDETPSVTPKTALFLDSLGLDGTGWDERTQV